MKLDDWRDGWRTDAILHRAGGVIEEQPDCLVIRTPSNPTFYWGNCILLKRLPADADCARWLRRFEQEIGSIQPRSRHVAIGVDDQWCGERLPTWEAAGFQLLVTTMMRATPDTLRAPTRGFDARAEVRTLDLHGPDGEALIELESRDAEGFEPEGYRAYLREQHVRLRRLQDGGQLAWFGLWCDGTLAASCGLIREAPVAGGAPPDGRFQRVLCDAAFRRRGLASALVHHVARFGLDRWHCPALWLATDADGPAFALYRALGFAPVSTAVGLQRNAPADGGPTPDTTTASDAAAR